MAPILIFDGINNGFADIIQCNPGNMKMPLRRVGMIPQIAAEGMAFPEKMESTHRFERHDSKNMSRS